MCYAHEIIICIIIFEIVLYFKCHLSIQNCVSESQLIWSISLTHFHYISNCDLIFLCSISILCSILESRLRLSNSLLVTKKITIVSIIPNSMA